MMKSNITCMEAGQYESVHVEMEWCSPKTFLKPVFVKVNGGRSSTAHSHGRRWCEVGCHVLPVEDEFGK